MWFQKSVSFLHIKEISISFSMFCTKQFLLLFVGIISTLFVKRDINCTLSGSSVLPVTWHFTINLLAYKITNSLTIPSFFLPIFLCLEINSKQIALWNSSFVKILKMLWHPQYIFKIMFGIMGYCKVYVCFILNIFVPSFNWFLVCEGIKTILKPLVWGTYWTTQN